MGARAEVEVEMMVAELLADQAPWARPTEVPTRPIEPGTAASLAGLRDTRGSVPLDTCVLVLTDVEPPDPMGLTAALVLFHVDGVASVGEIARSAEMSIGEVVACVYDLLAWGVVEIACQDAPESTLRLRQSERAGQRGSCGNR